MKETISVNLASQAFTFDKDAYRRLKEYLDAIRRRLPAGDPEILNDVEARLAEIFRSRISSPMMVVTLQMVQGAMAQMGDPSEFGELPTGEKRDEASVDAESASCVNSRHLYRSRTNRSIAPLQPQNNVSNSSPIFSPPVCKMETGFTRIDGTFAPKVHFI